MVQPFPPHVGQAAQNAATPLAQPIKPPFNFFDKLGKVEPEVGNSGKFRDQQGNLVDIAALKESLKQDFTTLSYGFSKCTQYCPYINSSLAAMQDQMKQIGGDRGITSIIIAVQPEQDGADQASRDNFMKHVQLMMKDKETDPDYKVVILYPVNAEGKLDNKHAPLVEVAFLNSVKLDTPTDHTATIDLYRPGGMLVASRRPTLSDDKDAPQKFAEQWRQQLSVELANLKKSETPPLPPSRKK